MEIYTNAQVAEMVRQMVRSTEVIEAAGRKLKEQEARIAELEQEVIKTRILEWNRGYDSGLAQGKINASLACKFQTRSCTGNAYPRMDPYAAELDGDYSHKMMCDACADERAQDI